MNETEIGKRKRQLLKEFIRCYESFPCLWNIRVKEYHDRELRARAYKVLVKKLQQIQPEADRSAVVRKINCLRSNLRKETRKISDYGKVGRVYKTKLWYYSLFNFLHGIARQTKTEPAESEEITPLKPDENKFSDPLEWSGEAEDEPQLVDNYQNAEPTREESRDSPTEYEVEAIHVTHPGPSKTLPNYEVQETSYRGQYENDRHDVFGKNVAMKLRHISSTSDTQRLMAENIINEALYLAEMGLLTQEHCKVLK